MYAVQIEVDEGEYTFVRKEDPWTYDTEVHIFSTKEQAEAEATSVLNEWAKEQVITEKQEVTAVVNSTRAPLHPSRSTHTD